MNTVCKILVGLTMCAVVASPGNAVPPPPSPGIVVGKTGYDEQALGSPTRHMVARLPGSDTVHFVWTNSELPWWQFPDMDRNVKYRSIILGGVPMPEDSGVLLGPWQSYPHAPELAVDHSNKAQIVLHKVDLENGEWYAPWLLQFPFPPTMLYTENVLARPSGLCAEAIRPRIAVGTRAGGDVISHMVALDRTGSCAEAMLWYWRKIGEEVSAPALIDTVRYYSIVTHANSDKCAIVFTSAELAGANQLWNLYYHESLTEGLGWLNGSELAPNNRHSITTYANPTGPQVFWSDFAAEYDNDGVLHVVWVEQDTAGVSLTAVLRHWDNSTGAIREITRSDWPVPYSPGYANLALAKVSIGIGDGSTLCQSGVESNHNYLYVTYSQFSGLTLQEQEDASRAGFYNGEIYLTVSRDGGASWSSPDNVTQTKTPNCYPGDYFSYGHTEYPDSVCRSEMWASLGRTVSDIDIAYISDLDAGSAVAGNGDWQMNDVMYYRIPGGTTDAPFLCPQFSAGCQSEIDSPTTACEFHASDSGSDSTELRLSNSGNATLNGVVNVVYTNPTFPPSDWLEVNGQQSTPFSIAVAGPEQNPSVTMAAAGLAEGLYQAEIRITHNDPNTTNPIVHPIEFVVGACDCHADPQCDDVLNVIDVIRVIGEAFRGESPIVDAFCPSASRNDFNCDCLANILDVVKVIDHAFRSSNAAICNPCMVPCP